MDKKVVEDIQNYVETHDKIFVAEIAKETGYQKIQVAGAVKRMKFHKVVNCPYCGEEIVVSGKLHNSCQKFCSLEHKNKYHSERRKKDKKFICEECGKEFYDYSFRKPRFCSVSCANANRNKQEKK